MSISGFVFAILGFGLALIGLIPLLGIVNYIALFFLGLGILFSVLGIVKNKKRGLGIAGLIIAIIFAVISTLRLIAGSGIV